MHYRPLGRSAIKVSPLVLGSWRMDRVAPDERSTLVNTALDAGINMIDTAPAYGAGQAEEWLGQILADRGGREKVVIATKSSGPDKDLPNGYLATRRHLLYTVENSLRRLKTDYIDLLQLHAPEPQVPLDETLGALTDLVRSGKVRYIGTSNFMGWQLVEALWVAKEFGYQRFVSDQSCYHLLDRSLEGALFPAMQTFGVGELVYSPLAQGILTGKYQGGPERVPADSVFAHMGNADNPKVPYFFRPQLTDAVGKLVDHAAELGCTPTQLALAFVLKHPVTTAAIVGPRTLDQLHENMAAADLTLTDETMKVLDAINPPGEKIHGWKLNLYNHGPSARW